MASLRMFLGSVWQDVKAWRRGERRIAPRYVRGRIYEPRKALWHERENQPRGSGGAVVAVVEPLGTLEIKVIRANGEVEYRTVPLQLEEIEPR